MKFGIYVHIPFCSKRCSYCDFAVRTKFNSSSLEDYTHSLIKEIQHRGPQVGYTRLHSLYFGGGTPSLLPLVQLEKIILALKAVPFVIDSQTEITIEINPESFSKEKLVQYQNLGINRFSVGVQSFQPSLLKVCNREHSVNDNHNSIALLQGLNFSLDWLFGLPTQSSALFSKDADLFIQSGAPHISPYLLTLQEFHPMNKNRPPEGEQVTMLNAIRTRLLKNNFQQYEISNFAKPGFCSQHNQLYWADQAYWGIGLSAHSYFPAQGAWGARAWNSSSLAAYQKEVKQEQHKSLLDYYPRKKVEVLSKKESLQDFCYTHLRTSFGLSEEKLLQKFGKNSLLMVKQQLASFVEEKQILHKKKTWLLTPQGINISNNIFLKLSLLTDKN
ncbi:MAG: radical SAM family heme chaperone HemW [Bdellovibrionaceae bacterium]|nr:radical SAM family heme chaperone HemW [Pseudobdellovibrionaceae bacterium]